MFLATAHEVSHDLAPQFLEAGCVVFDLSGAFRVNDATFYEKYYGTEAAHENAKAFHDKCENKDLRVCGRG